MLFVSLTTIPPRFSNIFEKLYNFYINQTIKVDKIILNICKNYKRFNNNIEINDNDIFKSKLEELNIIIINFTEDYGALTKLYPTIKLIKDTFNEKCIDIITIDDDCEYIDNLIEILMKNAIKFDRKKAIGFFGFNLDKNNNVGEAFHPSIENNYKSIDVLGGVNGLYYNLSFFDDINNYNKYISELSFDDLLCDDEVSNLYLKYKKIDRIMINENTFKKIDVSAYDNYALHKNNVNQRQNSTIKKCIKILEKL